MFPSVHYDPWTTDFDAIETVGDALVGGLYYNQGELFMFVYNASADTDAVKGKFAAQDNGGAVGEMTMKAAEVMDGTLGTVTRATGVWCYAVQFGNWGFTKVVGYTRDENGAAFLVTDGGVNGGDPLVCDGGATPTFIADKAIGGEEHAIVAHALAADDATPVVLASLNCLA